MPAALEIAQTPPLPAARWLAWSLIGCVVAFALWSVCARVDIVAVAPGRVVTAGRTKVVQAHAPAVIARLHVREGQRVTVGELLIELDATTVNAEAARLATECTSLALDVARLSRLMATTSESISGGDTDPAAGASAEAAGPPAQTPAALQFAAQLDEYRAVLAEFDAEHRQRKAEDAALRARAAELTRALPLVIERVEAYRALAARGLVARVHRLAVERERIETEQELLARRAELRALAAARGALDARRAATAARFRAQWSTERESVARSLAGCEEARAKNARARELSHLHAPIDGTVQQLAVHTEGGVVAAAQPLMLIAPASSPLEVEARVMQRDIGFVRIGQRAVVKIDAFEYTHYGYVTGRVVRLSRDAVQDTTAEPYFLAQVALDAVRVPGDGARHAIEPGMQAVVELAIGRRRIAEYLLSPVLRHIRESVRER